MSTPNPVLTAAAPELIATIVALKTFVNSMGTDPAKWALNYPGARLILAGSLLQQLPALAQAEAGALNTAINAQFDAWIAALQKHA